MFFLPPLPATRFCLASSVRFAIARGMGAAIVLLTALAGTGIPAIAQTESPGPSADEAEALESLEESSICLLRDSEGNVQDLSRLCRTGRSNAVIQRPFTLPELQPARPFDPSEASGAGSPLADSLPDYGVIFLSPISEEPIHIGYRSSYLSSYVGNASSDPLENVRIYYDILLSSGKEYAPIGQGSKIVSFVALNPGQRQFVSIIPSDVMDQVPPAYRGSRDISIQVKAIGWTGPDGKTSSFDAKSYQLSQGVGQCYFPWEKDGRGLTCGSRAISERL